MDKEQMTPASRSDEKKPISQKTAPWQHISDRKGLIFAIFCGISSCGQFIFVSLAELDDNFTPFQCIFFRNILFLFVTPLVSWERSNTYGPYDAFLCILLGCGSNFAAIFLYTALLYADIGNVSAVALNTPIPSAILAYLLLREKISVFSSGFFFLNFIGIILLAKPPFLTGNVDSADINGDDFLGIMLAFAALMSVSLSLIPIRLLSHRGNCDSYLNIVIVGYVGMIISGVSLSITSGWAIKTDILHFIYLLIFTGFAFLTNLFAILAAEHEVIANVSVLIACSSLPLNFLAQVALFHQMVDIISITGLTLIIGSTVGYYMNRK